MFKTFFSMTTGTWKTTTFMSTWWWTGRERRDQRVWKGVEATLQEEAPVASASQASPAKFEMKKNNGLLTLWSAASKRSSLKNQGSLDWRGNPSWFVTPRGGVQFSNLNITKVVWDVNDLISCYENLVFWALSGFGFMLSFQRMAADWKQFFSIFEKLSFICL